MQLLAHGPAHRPIEGQQHDLRFRLEGATRTGQHAERLAAPLMSRTESARPLSMEGSACELTAAFRVIALTISAVERADLERRLGALS